MKFRAASQSYLRVHVDCFTKGHEISTHRFPPLKSELRIEAD
jgi:hypothetical protein